MTYTDTPMGSVNASVLSHIGNYEIAPVVARELAAAELAASSP